MKRLTLIVLAMCFGFVSLIAQNLIAEYEFDGTLTDRLNGSVLTAFGPANDGYNRNNIESGFLEDGVGTYWYWLSNLARGGGFIIDVNQNISTSYSIGLRFSFNSTGSGPGSGYRKIIDYQNSSSDNGFYFHGYRLNFYPVGTGATQINNNQLVDLVATRSSNGTFKAYFVINGILQTPAELNVNAGASGVPTVINGKPRFGFFFDDIATGSEATNGGKVYSIKIWDAALNEAQIQQALNPKATLANVLITGTTGVLITPKDVVVSLLQGETIGNPIAENTDLSSWITNLPAGLMARAKSTISAGASNVPIEVYGTPAAISSAQIKITIPGSALTNNVNILVAQNPDARFGIAPYRVTYNGNSQTSGTVPTDNNTYAEGDNVTVLSNSGNLAKTGYTFQGWNTKSDGSGSSYAVNETFLMGSLDVTFYARWVPSSFSLANVTTQAAINVSATSAIANGTLVSLGSPNPTAYGFCYGTNNYPAIYNSTVVNKGAATSTGAFNANLTGLAAGTTYYIRAFATNSAGTSYGVEESFITNAISWTGNTSSAWELSANWNASVPTLSDHVVIPNVTNYPVISSGVGASCNNLTINSGASLTVASGGTLITNGAVSGDITIQREITGSSTLTANKYHLVSVPLHPDNNSLSGLFLDSYLYNYVPDGNSWASMGTSTTTPLSETVGYMIYYPNASTTYSFTGQPNTGTFSPTVTYRGDASGYNFALVPNPYPSNIDWNSLTGWTKTNIGSTIWVYNNGSYATWNGTTGTNSGSRYIAVGQAFFVQTTASSPSLIMGNGVRTHNSATFLKNNVVPANQLRVKALANNMQDEIVAGFAEGMSTNYDPMEDALKLFGAEDAPQLYTLAGDSKVSINQLAELNGSAEIPMHFETEFSGEIALEFSQMESFPADLAIQLEDKLTGQWVNLRETSQYLFAHNPANTADRFVLHFGSAAGFGENENSNISSWFSGNTFYLSTPEYVGEKAKVEVFSVSGQLLFSREVTLSNLQQFNLNVKGAVITRITLNNKVLNTKAIVL